MMNDKKYFYDIHIFGCINKRDPLISKRPSCGNFGAENLIQYLKQRCRELGIPGLRVNKSLCLISRL